VAADPNFEWDGNERGLLGLTVCCLPPAYPRDRQMPRLTKKFIDAIKPVRSGDTFYWDDQMRGFGLRVKPSGLKSFAIQYRVKGASRRLTIGQYGKITLDIAKNEASRQFGYVAQGRDPSADRKAKKNRKTVATLCAEYLEGATQQTIVTRFRRPKKPSTLATDKSRIDQHIVPILGDRFVDEVSTGDVRKFYEEVSLARLRRDVRTCKRGRSRVRGGRGAANRTLGLLGGIFSYAVDMGYRRDNPTRGVRRHKDGHRTKVLTPDEFKRLSQVLCEEEGRGAPWQAIECIRLIAHTGLRHGEAVGLQWTEVDLDERVINLQDSKSGPSTRPIGEEAAKILKKVKARSSGPHVFPSSSPPKGPYGGMWSFLKRKVRVAIPELTPHVLRHSFASIADRLDMNESVIATLLGHSRVTTTAGYIHRTARDTIIHADRVSKRVQEMMQSGK
jgi:integrase